MKKLISLVLCAVISVFGFSGCTSANEAPPLTEIYASLQKVTNMPSMTLMPDNLIETLFGFDLTQFEEYIFAEATDPSVNADTIIMIKLADTADMNSVCDTLNTYLMSVKENTQSYSPVNFAKTERSGVCAPGNYVYMIITSEYFEAEQIIIKALNGANNNNQIETMTDIIA